MTWTKINNLALANNWQVLDLNPVAGSLFRITQTWDIYPQGIKALLAQSLSTSSPFEFFGTKIFYPSEDVRIIRLGIPEDFLVAGITNRYLLMKFYSRRQFTFEWNITVEAFSL